MRATFAEIDLYDGRSYVAPARMSNLQLHGKGPHYSCVRRHLRMSDCKFGPHGEILTLKLQIWHLNTRVPMAMLRKIIIMHRYSLGSSIHSLINISIIAESYGLCFNVLSLRCEAISPISALPDMYIRRPRLSLPTTFITIHQHSKLLHWPLYST